jgi:hypothetical protein
VIADRPRRSAADRAARKETFVNRNLFSHVALSAVLLTALCRPSSAQDETVYQKLLQSRAQGIVTLRVLSKFEANMGGQGASHEMRSEIQGVAVDRDGLIMVSNIFLNPYSLGMNDQAAQAGIKMTPTSIKVVFADDDKEYDAFLAATDTKLNLAFIKIENLAGKVISPVDFATGVSPAIGQQLFSVSRLSRGYDYSAFVQTGRINGEIVRPRRAWLLDGSVSGFGLPVYTPAGELVGVITTIPSSIKEDSQNPDTMGMAMAMRMMSGGGMLQPFIIPASTVQAVITQAKASAIEVAAKRKAAGKTGSAAEKASVGTRPVPAETPKKPAKPKKP